MKINKNVLHHEINGEMVLLHVPTGNYFSLNDIGSAVWKGLSEGTDTEAIITRLENEYDADYETIKHDVENMITQMKDEGLISI